MELQKLENAISKVLEKYEELKKENIQLKKELDEERNKNSDTNENYDLLKNKVAELIDKLEKLDDVIEEENNESSETINEEPEQVKEEIVEDNAFAEFPNPIKENKNLFSNEDENIIPLSDIGEEKDFI